MSPATGLKYPWIEPSSVKTEGKYRVTADGQIRVTHMVGRRERALLTTDGHSELVEMVKGVKQAHGDEPSGIFYINEWQHVLVKAGGGTWYAGVYNRTLEFDLDGSAISARASYGLEPGQPWTGPQVGVRYALAAAGDDVYCKRKVSANTERSEYLSEYIADAAGFARGISKFKPTGGRLYINEARELFTPDGDIPGAFTYLGNAPRHLWFPEPQVG